MIILSILVTRNLDYSKSRLRLFIRDDKIVEITGHERHRHNPSPISPEFSAPEICKTLRFSRTALAASIARTATLINAPIDMLDFMKQVAERVRSPSREPLVRQH